MGRFQMRTDCEIERLAMPQVPRVVPEYAAIETPHLRVQIATNWVHSRRVSQTLDAPSSTATTTTNGERVAFGIVQRRATTTTTTTARRSALAPDF